MQKLARHFAQPVAPNIDLRNSLLNGALADPEEQQTEIHLRVISGWLIHL
jgi:hypothetical protein